MSVSYRAMIQCQNNLKLGSKSMLRACGFTSSPCYDSLKNRNENKDSFFLQAASIHIQSRRQRINQSILSCRYPLYSGVCLKSSSTEVPNTTSSLDLGNVIPEFTPTPELSDAADIASTSSTSLFYDATNMLPTISEPSLASQGLGGSWPPGLVQHALQYLHVDMGLPWWGSIVAMTVVIRLCMLPIVIKSRKNAINLMNHMPTFQKLQKKVQMARQMGDEALIKKSAQEHMDFMSRNEINMVQQFMIPLTQAPVFMSMFWGLRPMANLPIESMKTGGALWFPDLTVIEPIYGLPLFTALTLLATVETGSDGATTDKNVKKFMRVLPFLTLPIMCNFPTAMLVYWFTSNSISLIQVAVFQIPSVQKACGFPDQVKHVIDVGPKKGFIESFKSSLNDMKISQSIMERERLDELAQQEQKVFEDKTRLEERADYVKKLEKELEGTNSEDQNENERGKGRKRRRKL